jgi:hypothetical protein
MTTMHCDGCGTTTLLRYCPSCRNRALDAYPDFFAARKGETGADRRLRMFVEFHEMEHLQRELATQADCDSADIEELQAAGEILDKILATRSDGAL